MTCEVTRERVARCPVDCSEDPPQRSRSHRDRDRSGQLVAGRYRVLRLLGRGGMGSVWLAVDCVLTRPVALKEPWRAETSTSPGSASSQLREARAACAVAHPGVVQVYDLVVDRGREWIVMEPLSGDTLAAAIRERGRLTSAEVVHVGLRLLEALQAVHREGFVHGDVKPANVHLDGTGRPVLTDFGLASGVEDDACRDPGHFVGSPSYTAPEVIRTGVRTAASDLFALGATLYHAAEGRRPFEDEGPLATALAVLHTSPAPALEATPLGQVIDSLLVKDPRRRLRAADARAWLEEIATALAGSTPASVPSLERAVG